MYITVRVLTIATGVYLQVTVAWDKLNVVIMKATQ